jgi:UPF0042 nucleotide-binding protein
VTDVRGRQTFDSLFDSMEKLRGMDCPYKVLFVEARW